MSFTKTDVPSFEPRCHWQNLEIGQKAINPDGKRRPGSWLDAEET